MVHQHNFMEYISTKKGLYVFCFKEGCSSPIGYSKNSKAKFTTSTFGSHNFQGILNQTQHTSEEGEGSISFMNEVSPNSSKKLATLKLNQCLVNKLVSHSSKNKKAILSSLSLFLFFPPLLESPTRQNNGENSSHIKMLLEAFSRSAPNFIKENYT